LGKALGSSGGFIAGRRKLIDLLINRARPFIFSTASPPAGSAAAKVALELIRGPEGERLAGALQARIAEFKGRTNPPSPIKPLMIGEESEALQAAQALNAQGIFAPAIRYPTVARGAARIRFSFSAAHLREDVEQQNRIRAAPRATV